MGNNDMRVHIINTLIFIVVLSSGCDVTVSPERMILGLHSYMNMDAARQALLTQNLEINVIAQSGSDIEDKKYPAIDTRITGFGDNSRLNVFAIFYRDQLMKVWVNSPDIESIPGIIKKDLKKLGISKIELIQSDSIGQLELSIDRARDGSINLILEDRALSEAYWKDITK